MHRPLALALIALVLCGARAGAAERPERIVALSWSLTEAVIALGEVPVGVADAAGYAHWVGRPSLPDGVADVGLRNEPNLERLAELKPDLIVVSDQQADMIPVLSKIAPVAHFRGFDADQDNAATSRANLRDLAARLGKAERADEILARVDARLKAAGTRVRAHFGGAVPDVVPIRLLTPTTVRVHAENSMALAALRGMGLRHPAPGKATDWGFVQRNVVDLAGFEDAVVLHIEPFAGKDKLYGTKMWQFMPFVRSGRYAEVAPVWTFGGAVSLARLAEGFADALVSVPSGAVE